MTLTDRVLASAREVATGAASSGELLELVRQLSSAAAQARVDFTHNSLGNPEIEPSMVSATLEVFTAWLHDIEQLSRAAEADDAVDVSIAADALELSSARLRAVQQSHEAALEREGQTPWTWLNRVLRHVAAAARNGRVSPHTRTLLGEAPAFTSMLKEHAACLQRDDERAAAERLIGDVEEALRDVAARLDGGSVDTSRLSAAAAQLAEIFGRHVEEAVSGGPSRLPFVNLAITAAERRMRGEIDAPSFDEVARRAQDAARAVGGEAAHDLCDALENLRAAGKDRAALAMKLAIGAVLQAAEQLAAALGPSAAWDEDEPMLDMISASGLGRGADAQMPQMLVSLQNIAESYLDGVAGDADLLSAVEKLDAVADRFSRRAAADAEGANVAAAMETLREAAVCLRSVAASRDRRSLDAAVLLMREAAEALPRG